MGFLRKLTGVQAQIDAAAKNADAQIAATQQAAVNTQATMNAQAKAAADQMQAQAAREAMADKAAEALGQPLQSAEVQLEDPTARPQRKTRGAFGRGTSGVSI